MNSQGLNRSKQARYLPKDEPPVSYLADQTVLLVIDPVNDFLDEAGAGWEMVKSTVKLYNVIENLKSAIAGAREGGIPVMFAPMAFTQEDYKEHQLQRRCGINRVMFENNMFLAGTWGADFHVDLKPQDRDIILLPHKSCSVFETDLPEHLQRLGTTHIVIAGMTANLCCETTGRQATELGYDVTFISDAIGAAGIAAYEAAIRINYPLVSNSVIEVNDFLTAIKRGDAAAEVLPGDKVLGTDRGEIGKVKDVLKGTETILPHMLVPRGILHRDTYIPLDLFVRRLNGSIIINVPKNMVDSMPWDQPPTVADLRVKYGQPASKVERLYHSKSPTIQEQKAA